MVVVSCWVKKLTGQCLAPNLSREQCQNTSQITLSNLYLSYRQDVLLPECNQKLKGPVLIFNSLSIVTTVLHWNSDANEGNNSSIRCNQQLYVTYFLLCSSSPPFSSHRLRNPTPDRKLIVKSLLHLCNVTK